MLIDLKQLKKIKVETQSGQYLGKVIDFELETDNGSIEKYYVKSNLPVVGLFEGELLINKKQIISFDNEKMIVEDNAVKEKYSVKDFKKAENVNGIEPAITSELNNQS